MAASIDPSAILGQVTEGFMKLPLLQKILLPLMIVGTFVGILLVSEWASRPEYSVLFSDLEPADSGAIIERLKEDRIAYQVRSEGKTVAVSPPELVHELRIKFVSEGVLKSGNVGFEIFDSAELGTTTFQEKMKFLRASQGELERTIMSMPAVQAARVHITQPERTVFARKGSEATASVLLKLKPGAELEKRQILGIARLVAGSVESLQPENVSIVDEKGHLLTPTEQESEDSFGQEATRLQYQRNLEKGYVQRIEQMLARVVGAERIVARVSAELDFSKNEREEESFDPGGRVIRSERSIEEGAGGEARGGIPGVVSNLEDAPTLLAPENGASNNRKEEVRNYEVSRSVTRTSAPRGQLTRLSVAVLIDANHLNAMEGATGLFGSDLTSQIESIVRSAVGFDITRGDTVTVESVPFQAPETDFSEVFANQGMQDFVLQILQYLAPTVLVILFFMLFVRPFVKFLTTPSEAEVDLDRLLPTGMKELEAELNAERKRASMVPEYEAPVDIEQLEELMAENSRVVRENPGQAALLIRYWLNDGRL